MPLYEYQCDDCGTRFEKIQKFSDPPVEACSSCGGRVRKLLSSPAIQFKGSGWYITDYARKGGQNGGSEASPPAKAEPAKTSSEASTTAASTTTGSASSSGGTDSTGS